MSEIVALEVVVRGRVQGVWFRAWTEEEASRRGLAGWVRNNADRSVSALFVGPRPAVDEMLAACRVGPPAAQVESVEATPVDPPSAGGGFRVLR
jgi:acylphosphatase